MMPPAMQDDFPSFPEPPSRLDAAPLYVSLFLVLLVFFIVLNSVSRPSPDRKQRVLAGLATEFSEAKAAPPAPAVIAPKSPEEKAAGERLTGQIESLAASYLELTDMKTERHGDQTLLRVSLATLFKKNSTELRANRLPMLDAIAEAAKSWQPPYRLEIACILPLAPGADADARDRAITMASGLVQRLVDSGVAPAAVSAGIRQEAPGSASFIFTLRPANETWPTPEPAP